MSATADNAGALQSVLSSLGVLTVQQLVELFRNHAAVADFPALLHATVPEIVGQHAQAAATVAAQWYDDLAPEAQFHATPVSDLSSERVAKSIDWALQTKAPPIETPEDAISPVLNRLTGSAKRMVYDAARDTITENAAAENVGWARYAFPDACAFCRVLATRSGDNLYMSEKSAQFVVGRGGKARGSRKLGEKYHDHCRCQPYPIRAGDFEPPDYTQKWQKQYEAAKSAGNYSFKDILAHMRANTDAH